MSGTWNVLASQLDETAEVHSQSISLWNYKGVCEFTQRKGLVLLLDGPKQPVPTWQLQVVVESAITTDMVIGVPFELN